MVRKTVLLLSQLRRSFSSSLSPLSTVCIPHLLNNRNHVISPTPLPQPLPLNSLATFRLYLSESFSTRSTSESDHESWTNSELVNTELNRVTDSGACTGEESVLPIRALISLLDGFHDLTGLPWWFIIFSSTIAMRLALFPLLVLKLHKLKRISELFPKLPPPLPPPMSGRSFIDQLSLFQKERRAIGCPSFLWFLSYLSVQGSLVYWATNSSVSIIQQLSLKNPSILTSLGLPVKDSQQVVDSEEPNTSKITPSDPSTKQHKISMQDLSPKQLVNLSVKRLSEGHKEKSIPLLQLALDKDPGYVRALIVLGQILLQKGQMAEATEHLERAISQLLVAGYPSDVEEIDLLILACQWAGVTCIKQERNAEGIVHLQRVANINEPEDPKSKAHYFEGLVLLASALYNEGLKVEAAKYLRLAAAYDPKYNEFLEQCESEDDFASDIVSSRRRDY